MKKLIINVVVSAFVFCGCQDFLDRQPLDQLSQETFFKSKQDIEAGLIPTYLRYRAQMIGGMGNGNGSAPDMDALSDNGYSSSGFQGFQNIAQGGMTSTTGGAVTGLWEQAWQGVAYCNFFLDNLEREEVKSLINETDYKKYRGEALFNRCYFYFLLIQQYGDIPLILNAVTTDMPYIGLPRDPVSKIVTQLLSDMDLAIEGLPLVAYTNGHAVKGSAILLKTRILMYDKQFAEAAATAYSLIGDPANPHRLSDNFSGIFFGEQENNPEILFSVWYASPDDLHQFDQYTGSRMSCYPLFDLVKAFEEKSPGVKDPRLRMTLFMVGDPWVMYENPEVKTFQYTSKDPNGGPDIILDPTIYTYSAQQFPPRDATPRLSEGNIPVSGLAWKKGVDTTKIQARDKVSSQHCVLMRYADLLLLYAEAMFEAGQGSDSKALKALNDVRGRVGVEMPPKTELTREIVRNERRVELAYEAGIRYFDIKRWDIAKDVIPLKDPNPTIANKVICRWDGNLWPIPQNVMNIMAAAGWKNNAPY